MRMSSPKEGDQVCRRVPGQVMHIVNYVGIKLEHSTGLQLPRGGTGRMSPLSSSPLHRNSLDNRLHRVHMLSRGEHFQGNHVDILLGPITLYGEVKVTWIFLKEGTSTYVPIGLVGIRFW